MPRRGSAQGRSRVGGVRAGTGWQFGGIPGTQTTVAIGVVAIAVVVGVGEGRGREGEGVQIAWYDIVEAGIGIGNGIVGNTTIGDIIIISSHLLNHRGWIKGNGWLVEVVVVHIGIIQAIIHVVLALIHIAFVVERFRRYTSKIAWNWAVWKDSQ